MSDYEYACMITDKKTGEPKSSERLIWEDKRSAEAEVKLMQGSAVYGYVLVKRRKAGPVERVEND